MKELVQLLEGYVQRVQRTLIEAGLKIGFVEKSDGQVDIDTQAPINAQYLLLPATSDKPLQHDANVYAAMLQQLKTEYQQLTEQVETELHTTFAQIAKQNPKLWPELQKRFQLKLQRALLFLPGTGADRIRGYLGQALIQARPDLNESLREEIAAYLAKQELNTWQTLDLNRDWSQEDKEALVLGELLLDQKNEIEKTHWNQQSLEQRLAEIKHQINEQPQLRQDYQDRITRGISFRDKTLWQQADSVKTWTEAEKARCALEACVQEKIKSEAQAFWAGVVPSRATEDEKSAYVNEHHPVGLLVDSFSRACFDLTVAKYPDFASFMMGEFESLSAEERQDRSLHGQSLGSACNKAHEDTLLEAKNDRLISDRVYRIPKIWTTLQELGENISTIETRINREDHQPSCLPMQIGTMLQFHLATLIKDYITPFKLASASSDRSAGNDENYLQLLPEKFRFLLAQGATPGSPHYIPIRISEAGQSVYIDFRAPSTYVIDGAGARVPFVLKTDRSDFTLTLELSEDRKAIKSACLKFDAADIASFDKKLKDELQLFIKPVLLQLTEANTPAQISDALVEAVTLIPGAFNENSIIGALERIAAESPSKPSKSEVIQLCRTYYTAAEKALQDPTVDVKAKEALAVLMLTSRNYIQKNGSWWQWAKLNLTQIRTPSIDIISRNNPDLSVGFTSPKSELARLAAEDLDLNKRQQRFVDKNFPAGKVVSARNFGYVISNLVEQLSHRDFKIRAAASAKLKALLADQRKITVVGNEESTVQKATLDYLLTKAPKDKFKGLSPEIKAGLAECLQAAYVETYWQDVDPVVARPALQPEFEALLNGQKFNGFTAFNQHLLQVYDASPEYRVALLRPDVLEVDELYRQAFNDNGVLVDGDAQAQAQAQANARLKAILQNDTNYEFFSTLLNKAHKTPYTRIVRAIREGCLQDEFIAASVKFQKVQASAQMPPQAKVAPLPTKPLVLAKRPNLDVVFKGFVQAARRVTPKDVNESLRTACERGSWFSNGVKRYDETSESGTFRLCAMHEIFASRTSIPLIKLALQLASGANSAGMVTGQVFSSLGHFVNDLFMTAADGGCTKYGAISGRYEDEAKLVQDTFTHKNHTVFGNVLSEERPTKPIIGLTTTLTITDNQGTFAHHFDYDLTIYDLAASFEFFQKLTSDHAALQADKHYKTQIKPYANLPELLEQMRQQIFATLRDQLADTAASNVQLELTSAQQEALYNLVFASPASLAEFLGNDVANADKNLSRLLALFKDPACKKQAKDKIISWFYAKDDQPKDPVLLPFLVNAKIWWNSWDRRPKVKEEKASALPIVGPESGSPEIFISEENLPLVDAKSVMPKIFANEKSLLIFLQSVQSPGQALRNLWGLSTSHHDDDQQQHLLAQMYSFYALKEKDPELEKLLVNADVITFLVNHTSYLAEGAAYSNRVFNLTQIGAQAVISSVFASEQSLLAFLGEEADGATTVAKFNRLMEFCGDDESLKNLLTSKVEAFLNYASQTKDSLLAGPLVTQAVLNFVSKAAYINERDLAKQVLGRISKQAPTLSEQLRNLYQLTDNDAIQVVSRQRPEAAKNLAVQLGSGVLSPDGTPLGTPAVKKRTLMVKNGDSSEPHSPVPGSTQEQTLTAFASPSSSTHSEAVVGEVIARESQM